MAYNLIQSPVDDAKKLVSKSATFQALFDPVSEAKALTHIFTGGIPEEEMKADSVRPFAIIQTGKDRSFTLDSSSAYDNRGSIFMSLDVNVRDDDIGITSAKWAAAEIYFSELLGTILKEILEGAQLEGALYINKVTQLMAPTRPGFYDDTDDSDFFTWAGVLHWGLE